jgi:quinol monooxygenase YgiN
VAPDERRTALLRALGSMLGPTRVAPGCLDARLYSDLDKRKTLLLVEDWESREQFESAISTWPSSMRLSRPSSYPARRRWFGLMS